MGPTTKMLSPIHVLVNDCKDDCIFDKKTLQNLFLICQQVQEFYFEYIQQSQFGDQFFVCHGKDFLDHHSILHKKNKTGTTVVPNLQLLYTNVKDNEH